MDWRFNVCTSMKELFTGQNRTKNLSLKFRSLPDAWQMEAQENVEKVISEWIETADEIGREIPVPKGKLMYA